MSHPELLSGFVQNAALLLIVALIFDLRTRSPVQATTPQRSLGLGLLIGGAGVFTMLFPVRLEPGLILDARGLLLAISGVFFGTVPTVVAMVITAAYRVFGVGGPSVAVGVSFIIGSGLLGLGFRAFRHESLTALHWFEFVALGFAVAMLQILLARYLLPSTDTLIWGLAPTLLIVSMASMLVLGLLLTDRSRRAATLLALAEREASFRALTERLPAIVYRAALDANSTTLYVSPAIVSLGYKPEEWLDRTDLFVQSLHPDDRERVLAQLQDDRRNDRASDLLYRFRHRNGSWRTIHDRAEIVRDPQGRSLYLQGVMMDVTDQQRAAAANALQAAALDAAVDAIAISDREGNYTWVNQAFTALTQYRAHEALGRNPRELLKTGHQSPEFYAELWGTLLAGRVWTGILVNRRKDGSEYTEEQTITPVRDASGQITHFIAIKRDVTQRRMLEAQMAQAQRVEGIGRLAGGVAHDFNNLLTVINGTVELALTRVTPNAAAAAPLDAVALREELATIRDAAQRGATLTRQLLAFSRQQVLHSEKLHLNTVVREMHAMLSRVIGERVQIKLDLAEDLDRVRADGGQLGQVLMNLVVNARDAMPGGGTIFISTKNVDFDDETAARHVGVQPGAHVLLQVNDTGVGMDASVRDRIFEPFFTTKPAGKGTGLGLPMVYGIVKQHGGSVWVYSEPGHGSNFTLAFPALSPEENTSADPPSARRSSGPTDAMEATVSQGETILLVEDEDAIRRVASRVLATRGYRVLEAGSGEEALGLAAGKSVDLLLTDMVMPGMTGPELAGMLRERQPGLKVLFTSGYSKDAVAQQFGMDDGYFLAKPYGLRQLVSAVVEALGEG